MIDELAKRVDEKKSKIAIVGLGYVGLPLALGFSKAGFPVVGFDINEKRVGELKKGIDKTLEADRGELADSKIMFTNDEKDISDCEVYIITVPTPVDEHNVPDLGAVRAASEMLGRNFGNGKLVVLESTVYPGVTEEVVVGTVEKLSGKEYRKDFVAGYSPERVNPGDKEHTLKTVTKVVSGTDRKTAEVMKSLYSSVSDSIFIAKSIKVGEAAKVIENTQRDINIALINELTVLFNRMDIPIYDVLEAAETKWNFLRFKPGLVGGHCIPVDPYYLVYKAKQLGFDPRIIAAGRKVNNEMASYMVSKLLKELNKKGTDPKNASGVAFGLTFKENVPDLRNSLVKDVVRELKGHGVKMCAVDPFISAEDAKRMFGVEAFDENAKYDFAIVAVAHKQFHGLKPGYFSKLLKEVGILFDVKRMFKEKDISDAGLTYLTL